MLLPLRLLFRSASKHCMYAVNSRHVFMYSRPPDKIGPLRNFAKDQSEIRRADGRVRTQVPDQFQGAGSYETAALDCSLMPRSLALLGHSMDIADAAIILNQHITDRLAALPGSAESSYTLHFIIPPDLAFTLRTASSGLYRCNHSSKIVTYWHRTHMIHLCRATVPGRANDCSAL